VVRGASDLVGMLYGGGSGQSFDLRLQLLDTPLVVCHEPIVYLVQSVIYFWPKLRNLVADGLDVLLAGHRALDHLRKVLDCGDWLFHTPSVALWLTNAMLTGVLGVPENGHVVFC
jgi:hypothetical protein